MVTHPSTNLAKHMLTMWIETKMLAICQIATLNLSSGRVTFTFGKDSMLSSAEAIISFGSMRSPEITKRL